MTVLPVHAARLVTPAMVGVGLFLATVPLWIGAVGLYPYLVVEILIWSIYALAFNLLLGTAGLPSFGHGAYFGVGAYAFGLTQFHVAANLWVCLAGALAAAGLAGVVVALFISHRRGIYYAFMTIAFGQIAWFVALKAYRVTGGEDGLLKIARLPLELGFGSVDLSGTVALYYFVLGAFLVVVAGMWRLVHSPFGRVLAAIRQSELRAAHLGYAVRTYKVAAFTISAAVSGFAGGLFAMAQNSAFPDVMSLHQSGVIVMMVLIGGGLVSFWGPVIGVVVYIASRDVIGAYSNAWMLWFGLLFIGVVLFQPEGVAGGLAGVAAAGGARGAGGEGGGGAVTGVPVLEARGVHVRFGDRVVLEDVSLGVEAGGFHGVMGPNGAGKTTFFNVLTGRTRPDRGAVLVGGVDVTGRAVHSIAALGVARSFQTMTLFDAFTVRENVVVALPEYRAQGWTMHRAGVGDAAVMRAADAVLADVGLDGRAGVLAGDLSYGDRRALEIAVALAQRPAVLCLDEPTSGLGSDGVLLLAGLVRRLKGTLAIVAIEHDMSFLFGLADEISVIHWGQVIARGTPDALRANPWLQRSNLGRLA